MLWKEDALIKGLVLGHIDEYQGWYFHPSQKYGQELSREETQEYLDNLNISHINKTDGNIHVWLETYGLESIMLEKRNNY